MEQKKHSAPGLVAAVKKATLYNDHFRREMWTGEYLQITVMSIPVGGEVGEEIHDDLDQMLYVEQGAAAVYMGASATALSFMGEATEGDGILVPAGTHHNVINDGRTPLKMFSVYAPPQHPVGTDQKTKADADKEE